jgi:phosphatidylglycerol lysyltransferase
VTVRVVPSDELTGETRRGVDAVIGRWLGSKQMAPMGFLVHVDPFAFPEERRYLVAEREGRVVGFLSCVPVYGRAGWLLEDLLRDPAAPNGTSELLVDGAMRALAAEKSEYVTLGLAPLAGDVSPVLRAARAVGRALYDFEGVRAFKAKLRPRAWEPIYLSYPRTIGASRAVLDALVAFSRDGLLRFGLATLLRGPAVLVRVLALLLVPWTILLALPVSGAWFPSRAAQLGWVGFDALIAAGLFALMARWRAGLATALALLVTTDAVVTPIEAILYNGPRIGHVLDALVLVAATLAPIVAAIVLWSARARHARWDDMS